MTAPLGGPRVARSPVAARRSWLSQLLLPDDWRARALLLGGPIAVLWLVFAVDKLAFGGALEAFGLTPRTRLGLVGILCSPFLHLDLGHIASNTIGLLLLGGMVLGHGKRRFAAVSLMVMLLGGALEWCAARSAVHVGASGVVYGYLGYLVAYGFFAAGLGDLLRSLLFGFLFSGMVWGLSPTQTELSWEGHLFGLLAGIVAAWLLAPRAARKDRP